MTTPHEQARHDQIDAKMRDHVLELVRTYREAKADVGEMRAQKALLMGLVIGGPSAALGIAVMAVTLLAREEDPNGI